MTFSQIECFVEVARCRNFTKASKNLFISQQVVSKQVQALEKELNLELFNRTNRQIELTRAGAILFSAWEKMLNENQKIIQEAREANNISKTKIRLGINEIPSIIDYFMPKIYEAGKRNPGLEFEYKLGSAVYLMDRLEKNKLDIIITFSSEAEVIPDINFVVLDKMNIELSIILSKDHPLAKNENLTLKDIKNENVFLFNDRYSKEAAKRILGHFDEEGFYPEKIREFETINSMEMALNLREGVTVAYNAIFRNSTGNLKFYPLYDIKGYKKVDLAIAWKNKEFEKYANEFLI